MLLMPVCPLSIPLCLLRMPFCLYVLWVCPSRLYVLWVCESRVLFTLTLLGTSIRLWQRLNVSVVFNDRKMILSMNYLCNEWGFSTIGWISNLHWWVNPPEERCRTANLLNYNLLYSLFLFPPLSRSPSLSSLPVHNVTRTLGYSNTHTLSYSFRVECSSGWGYKQWSVPGGADGLHMNL